MKAIVQTEYGSPDVLSLAEVEMPAVSDNGVLVRVLAASVNAADWHLMRGNPWIARLALGLRKPKFQTLGMDVAGRVAAIGKNVTQFQVGDEVFGDISECGFGAFAEYVCVPEDALVVKPKAMTFEQAAAVPGAALTALHALCKCGQIQSGQRVLINGASGGVGSFAVQIAKAFGAEVTAVCNGHKMEMMRSIGADHVIDYTKTDVTKTGQTYDLIVDAAAFRSVFDFLPILTRSGRYVLVGGSTKRLFQTMLFFGPLISSFTRRTAQCFLVRPNQADLVILKDLLESGKITPFIDRSYPLSEVPIAIRHLEERQVQGKVVILV